MQQIPNRAKAIMRVSMHGIAVNLILVIGKAAVGLFAGSIAVILDAVNNFSDALSSLITMIGAKLAGKAADRDHPYGHGRVEYIASSLVAMLVLAAGVSSLRESVLRILYPSAPDYTAVSLVILGCGVIAKLLLGFYFRRQGVVLHSDTLSASGTDALFDAVIGFATLVSALVNMLLHRNPEGFLGIVISILILRAGVQILRDTVDHIIGTRADSSLVGAVKERICSDPEVQGAYDLILHNYGPDIYFGSVHIEVNDTMTVRELDALTRKLVNALYVEFGVLLTIGIYATNTYDGKARKIKAAVQSLCAEYSQIVQTHGFYLDEKEHLATFDVIFDYSVQNATELASALCSRLQIQFPDTRFSVNIDRNF